MQEIGSEQSESEFKDKIENQNFHDNESENRDTESDLPVSDFTWFAELNDVNNIVFIGSHGINPIISRQLAVDSSELDVFIFFLTTHTGIRFSSSCNTFNLLLNHRCIFR